jgi:hypothetical protein
MSGRLPPVLAHGCAIILAEVECDRAEKLVEEARTRQQKKAAIRRLDQAKAEYARALR